MIHFSACQTSSLQKQADILYQREQGAPAASPATQSLHLPIIPMEHAATSTRIERASASWLREGVTLSKGLDKALLCPAGSWRSAAAQAVDLSLTHMGINPRPSLIQVNAPPPAIVCSSAVLSLSGSTPFLKETQLQHIWFVPRETRHPSPTTYFLYHGRD